jgi:signal transduction histidine kinase
VRLRAQLRRKQFQDENRRIRERLQQSEKDALEAKAARDLAATREALLADLRKVNEDLVAAKDLAERESRFKSRFLASMSHELRTPLNGIIGFRELLQDPNFGPLTSQQREFTDHVLQASHHLLDLINDVLDLSKIEAGRLELQRQPLPLELLIVEVLQVSAALAQKRNVHIATDVAADLPDLDADPIRCKQALFNLVSNAVKFSPKGGEVVVSASHDAGWVHIAVQDRGPGIARDDLPRLFSEFEQIDKRRRGAGTGLGLALTSRLTRLHGGRIDVQTELDKGSTFSLVWPAVGTVAPAMRTTM